MGSLARPRFLVSHLKVADQRDKFITSCARPTKEGCPQHDSLWLASSGAVGFAGKSAFL
jgi:hypothetical protein